jgi:hypothetical protein
MIECEIILDKFGERVVDKKSMAQNLQIFTKLLHICMHSSFMSEVPKNK